MDSDKRFEFLSLPSEIQQMILGHMSRAELVRVCRTSKLLKLETEHRLYRHVSWTVCRGEHPSSDKIACLLGHLLRRPEVATWIEVIELDERPFRETNKLTSNLLSPPVPKALHDTAIDHLQAAEVAGLQPWRAELTRRNVEAAFAIILLLAVNVRRFVLRAFFSREGYTDQTRPVGLMFLIRHILRLSANGRHSYLQRLEHIEFHPHEPVHLLTMARSRQPTIIDVMAFMQLPNIKTIITEFDEYAGNLLHPETWPSGFVGSNIAFPKSATLTELTLRCFVPALNQLARVLSATPELKIFNIEMLHDDSCSRQDCNCFDLLGLSQALKPCKGALERLLILCYEGGTMSTQDSRTSGNVRRAVGSLKMFTKLRQLDISAGGLLDKNHNSTIASILPPSIETLNMRLDDNFADWRWTTLCDVLQVFVAGSKSHAPKLKALSIYDYPQHIQNTRHIMKDLFREGCQIHGGPEIRLQLEMHPFRGRVPHWSD